MKSISSRIEGWLWRAVLFAGDFRVFGWSAFWLGHFPGAGFLIRRAGRDGFLKEVRIRTVTKPVYVRLLSTDVATLRDIFVKLSYDLAGLPQAKYLDEYYSKRLESGIVPIIID